ncbi:aminotransferase V [Spirochaetia bacterium]|nr:aminotransferase V [Spirochaetia bacterium]
MKTRYYFDWAATALPDAPPDLAAAKVLPFGNPSSKHTEGRRARDALEDARRRCAAVLGVAAKELYFTSGGTEANAIVLHSLLLRKSRSGAGGLLYSAVEHPSIRENAALLERLGKPAAQIAVEADGRVSSETLGRALEKAAEPRLAAIMAVNNETGAVMDIQGLAGVLRARQGPQVHLHCDMVQGIGKVPVDLTGWDVDSAALSAHKLGGPRGIGLLYLRGSLEVIYAGGGQERGIRPGTENVSGALALADCLERHARPETVRTEYDAAAARMKTLIGGLQTIPRCSLIPRSRPEFGPGFSPYIVQAAFDGVPGEVMVRALDDAGFALSTGSACSSDKKARPILAAMGVDEKTGFEGIRISQGWSTTVEDIEALLGAITGILGVL